MSAYGTGPGNVAATISDRKQPVDIDSVGITDYYEPVVLSAADYYPFGMEMPGRTYQAGGYRFGFNGKEKDQNQEWGDLTHYDYGFRIYNPGIGRFLSVDPLTRSYPWYTPYQFAGNKPITFIDLDGLEEALPQDWSKAQNTLLLYKNDASRSNTVFPNISKQNFISSLDKIITSAGDALDQGYSNMCGITTACRVGLQANPNEYVNMAISLYETGSYKDKTGSFYSVNPKVTSSTINTSNSTIGTSGPSPVEFIVSGALKHSGNIALDYDPNEPDSYFENGTRGFTWPGEVDNIVSSIFGRESTPDRKNTATNPYLAIKSAIDEGKRVIGLFDWEAMTGNSNPVLSSGWHYVEIQQLQVQNQQIIMQYWDPNGNNAPPKTHIFNGALEFSYYLSGIGIYK